MKKLFLIPLMACMTCMAFGAEKFYFGVTDGSTPKKEVAMSVYDGLKLHLNVPANGEINKSAMDLHFRVTNVSSLGVSGQKGTDVSLDLDLDGTANLQEKLSSLYNFKATKVVVSVKAAGATQSFLYNFNAIDNGEIQATPLVESEAMAAWHLLANQLNVADAENEGYFIYAAAGSYFQFGGKKLLLSEGFSFDADFWTNANCLAFFNKSGVEDVDAANKIYLAEGSAMQLGHSSVSVKKDMTVTLAEGVSSVAFDVAALHTSDPAANFKAFGALLNNIAGYIDADVANGANACKLTINFGDDEMAPDDSEKTTAGATVLVRSGVHEGYFYTVCVPYGLTNIQGADFFVINQRLGSNLEFISVPCTEAGKPYVCIPWAGATEIYGESDGKDEAAGEYRGLVGTYEILQVPYGQNCYIFGNTKIRPASASCHIGANRAYINMTAVDALTAISAPGRVRKVVAIEQVATGMDEMPVELEGTQKVMVNGQLLIIRDGVKYNAQGVVVE